MSEICNKRICAIVILTVGGYLVTLPGSATATSTIQSTSGIPSNTIATHTNVFTTLPPSATTESGETTTQGYVSSTTKSVARTFPSTNTIDSSSTLETATKSRTTENMPSTEGYPTFTSTESPYPTISEASTEHLSTSSALHMSTASTEFLILQGSTSSPMEDQTSNTDLGITAGSTSMMMTSYTTTVVDTSASSTSMKGLSTTMKEVGTTVGSTSTTATTPGTSILTQTTMSSTSMKGLSTTMKEVGTTVGSTSTTATTPGTSILTQTTMSSTSMKGLSTTMTEVGTTVGSTSTTATAPGTSIPTQTTMSSTSMKGLSTTMKEVGTTVGSTSTTATTPGTSIPTQTTMSSTSMKGLSTIMKEVGTTVGSTSTTATAPGTSIPSQTTMSSTSMKGLSTTMTEVGTSVGSTSRMTTTSQSVTDRSTSTSPKSTTSPSYPAPTLADIESKATFGEAQQQQLKAVYELPDAVKKVKIEIKVLKEINESCVPGNKASCKEFIDNVETELKKYYQNIPGFFQVKVTNLRNGSILVEHNVSYTYSEMKPEDKGLTAQEVYDNTIGPYVAGGKLGGLNVSTCDECKEPEDVTNLCDFEDSVDCGVYVADCRESYVFCVSPCDNNPSFCSSRGDCNQDEGVAAKCSCHPVDNGRYYGDNCERYFNQNVTIICIAVAGGFIFGIAVACAMTRCRRKKRLGRYRQYYMDDMGEEGYLWNESYAVEGALEGEEDLIDLTSDDDPKLEFAFNSSLTPHTD